MRAAALVALVVGCGPTLPADWGHYCRRACPDGFECFTAVPDACTDPEGCGRCELPCTETCYEGWRCDESVGYCRIPCGPAFPPCPGGTWCMDTNGCAPI